MTTETDDSVLLNTFHSGNKRIRVIFHNKILVWDNEKPPSEPVSVVLQNIISIEPSYLDLHPSDEKIIYPNSFTVHYAEQKGAKWKYRNITLWHNDEYQVYTWVKTLQQHLQNLYHRPRNVLLFINPFGGKKNAMHIYEKFGKSLFKIAGVDVTVTVSQRKNQIRDYILNHNLELYDCIGCVGGDGTVSELFNGLVLKECKLQGIDSDDIKQELPLPKIPIGIIPGGSTDTIVHCLHGTTDPTTAVLQIIFGDTKGLDLVSVYDENNLLRLYASVLSYGYLGDVAYHSDQYRWMGPNRYNYSGFKKFIRNRGYEGEIAFLHNQESDENIRCFESCPKCTSENVNGCDNKEDCSQWRTLKGRFFMISGANISCACSRSPNGIAPFAHLGDGNLHLILVKHTSIFNNLKLLMRLSSKDQTVNSLPFVESFCVKEFCFRAINVPSKWNCDGEVQHQTNIRAKVRRQLLTIISRGAPKPPDTIKLPKNCCCCGL